MISSDLIMLPMAMVVSGGIGGGVNDMTGVCIIRLRTRERVVSEARGAANPSRYME